MQSRAARLAQLTPCQAYTALETWAFSLRCAARAFAFLMPPRSHGLSRSDPSTPPVSNCNSHQHIALIIVIALSASTAFFSSFLKHFVYDAQGTHVVYPPPDLFSVANRASDPVTRVQFPCRTSGQRFCWPLVDGAGEFLYDDKGERLRVMVFKLGVRIHVRRRAWPVRVWRAFFAPVKVVRFRAYTLLTAL